MSKITWQGVILGVLIGLVAAPQIRRIPFVNKIPTV
jgi:hypothetical protein